MPLRTPRYLVPIRTKSLPHFFTDVLVIGSGIAGLRAALAVDSRLSVVVVTKEATVQSNSTYAQGGIAGVLDEGDRFEFHVSDTITAGGTLCDAEVVEMVIREAPKRIAELREYGTHFDELGGELELGREGGHSHNRIVHAMGDMTGREVMRAMINHTHDLPNVQVWEHTFTLDLITCDGICRGALVSRADGGQMIVWARQTILATGGAGQVYRESTNPAVATADGHAMAYRAGCRLQDMEFVQFHPTVLYIAGGSRSLITEAIRGEGGRLVDKNGYRFMPEYDERGELAPRDVVSQAIVTQMQKTQHPCVYLDVTHLEPDFVKSRFPGIAAACRQFEIDITRDRIPVRPGAHYMIGGALVDLEGRTTLPGLWAAGEVTATGLHGGNRLASNSLLEGLVYGAHAGQGASQAALEMADEFRVYPVENDVVPPALKTLDLDDIRNSLKAVMWRYAGVRRSGPGLDEALATVDQWCGYVLPRQFNDSEGWELQNLLITARLIIRTALARTESRGVHLRTDHPEIQDPEWRVHLWCERDNATTENRSGKS